MSDPAPSESPGRAAFEELAATIRHVSDQLASYRRRALTAEGRVRDLEAVRDQLAARVARSDEQLARTSALLERSDAAAEQWRQQAAAAERRREEVEAKVNTVLPTPAGGAMLTSTPRLTVLDAAALEAENKALHARLSEARERSRTIGERVRFLRQQMSNGVEK